MKKIDLLKINWEIIQVYHDEGNDKTKIMNKFGLSRKILNKGINDGLLKFIGYAIIVFIVLFVIVSICLIYPEYSFFNFDKIDFTDSGLKYTL